MVAATRAMPRLPMQNLLAGARAALRNGSAGSRHVDYAADGPHRQRQRHSDSTRPPHGRLTLADSTPGLTRKINPCADDAGGPEDDAPVMSTFDYILGLSALALVLFNMRRHELTDRRLRRPLIIAAAISIAFLHTVPTSGGDGVLVAAGLLLGVACGAASGALTRVERDSESGAIISQASPVAVMITAGAFVARMGFAVAATNGLGPAIGRLSSRIDVHSADAWVAALVLMAAADLVVRAAVLWRRRSLVAADQRWAQQALPA